MSEREGVERTAPKNSVPDTESAASEIIQYSLSRLQRTVPQRPRGKTRGVSVNRGTCLNHSTFTHLPNTHTHTRRHDSTHNTEGEPDRFV